MDNDHMMYRSTIYCTWLNEDEIFNYIDEFEINVGYIGFI